MYISFIIAGYFCILHKTYYIEDIKYFYLSSSAFLLFNWLNFNFTFLLLFM